MRPKNRCRSWNRFGFLTAVPGAARRRKLQHSTSGGRNQRQRIFSSPKRTLLLDHIFNHRATSTFGWYFFRATNSMLTATGFVTEAYLMLSREKWSWLAFARQFVRIIKNDVVHLAIDDTLTLGASSSVRGQCWVSLAMDQAPLARPR